MNRLDWLAADPATFDWPAPRHAELEQTAAAIAATPWTIDGGLQVPAAAVAPAAAEAIEEIPISPELVAALAGVRA